MADAVSVLVVSRDRRDMLDALLSDLRDQVYPGEIEIVVVEETDDPRPPEGVEYVPLPVRNRGIAYARNQAVAHANHALLAFVDDDCRVDPDWLQKLLAPFADPDVFGVQGGVTVPEATGAVGWAESLLGFPGGGIARVRQAAGRNQDTREVSTLNAAYRRSAVSQAGGFPESARFGGEDYLLAKRMSVHGRLLFVPDAVVRHAARGSLPAIWRWFVRRGVAETELVRAGLVELTTRDYLRHLLRSSMAVKLVALLLLGMVNVWLSAIGIALWAGVIWSRLWWAWGEADVPKAGLLLVPLVKVVMDLGLDAGRFGTIWARR